jgi:hypothetical protein
LLRGIAPVDPRMRNVRLREVSEALELRNVTTVVSSGNPIFDAEAARLVDRELQRPLRPRDTRDVAPSRLASHADHIHHPLPGLREADLHLPQDACRDVVLVRQSEQQVFRPDVVVTKLTSLLLGQHHRSASCIARTPRPSRRRQLTVESRRTAGAAAPSRVVGLGSRRARSFAARSGISGSRSGVRARRPVRRRRALGPAYVRRLRHSAS